MKAPNAKAADAAADAMAGGRTQRVKEFFDDETGYLAAPLVREVRGLALRSLHLDFRGKRILDVGCGDGSLSLPFAAEAAELTLADLSPGMLAAAGRNAASAPPGRVRLVEGDLMNSDVGGDYDVVLCLGVLPHLSSIGPAIERLASLVKNKATLVVHINDADRPLGYLNWWFGSHWRRSRSGYAVQRLRGQEVVAVAARHGLRQIESLRYSFLVPGMGRLSRRVLRAIEVATIRYRPLGVCGTDRMIVFRKETGCP